MYSSERNIFYHRIFRFRVLAYWDWWESCKRPQQRWALKVFHFRVLSALVGVGQIIFNWFVPVMFCFGAPFGSAFPNSCPKAWSFCSCSGKTLLVDHSTPSCEHKWDSNFYDIICQGTTSSYGFYWSSLGWGMLWFFLTLMF